MSRGDLGGFDRALARRELDRAWAIAREVSLPLDRCLKLTIRLGEGLDLRYEPAARRLLIRVLEEVEPRLVVAKTFTDALAHAHTGIHVVEARQGLWGNVEDLRRIELRDNGFDSWARENPDLS